MNDRKFNLIAPSVFFGAWVAIFAWVRADLAIYAPVVLLGVTLAVAIYQHRGLGLATVFGALWKLFTNPTGWTFKNEAIVSAVLFVSIAGGSHAVKWLNEDDGVIHTHTDVQERD